MLLCLPLCNFRGLRRGELHQQLQLQQLFPQRRVLLAELERLGELHKQGILTDEEFAAKKKLLLGL